MYPPLLPQDEELLGPTHTQTIRPSTEGAGGGAPPSVPAAMKATVEQLLVEAAIQCPQADALVGNFGILSYADLLIRAQNIAVQLRGRGVVAGEFVGVVMDQSPAMVAAIAGILLAGAAYVPLSGELLRDPAVLRSARASGMRFLLEGGAQLPGLNAAVWREFGSVVDLSRVEQETMPSSDETRMPPTTPGSTAALLFRPGQGSEPLGVAIPHRAIARLVSSGSLLQFHANEIFLLHPANAARTSLLELWGSLLHGSTLALAPDASQVPGTMVNQSDLLAGCVRQFGVSTLCLPVSEFHSLVDSAPETFRRLNQLVIEHEGQRDALSPQRLEWLTASHPRLRITHSYGGLETSGYATSYLVPQPYAAQASVPIGAPIDGMRAHILDRELFTLRSGEIGELALAGDGVVNGYWNNPHATARHFLRSASVEDGSGHMFLTGERARLRTDGLLELHGRSAPHAMAFDDAPAVEAGPKASTAPSFSFAPADVEAMLLSQRKVRDAAVIEQTDERGHSRQVAFISLDPAAAGSAYSSGTYAESGETLEDSMRSALPAAAMPAAFRYVERIPRGPQGAVDPVLLEQRWKKENERARLEEQRQQEMLDQVRAIWMRLLQVSSVGYDEDFFEAGGTQVQMIRMHVELNRRFPGAITMANLSVLTTVRRIYEHLVRYTAENEAARRGA